MRMVVSLADLDDSRWINLTGVSGHAFHPHYTDQTDLMVAGQDPAVGVLARTPCATRARTCCGWCRTPAAGPDEARGLDAAS